MNPGDNDKLTPTGTPTGSTGLPQEIAVVLIYLFGWLGGLVFLLIEKENRFIRFHAMQSIVLSIGATVLFIALSILSGIPLLGFVFSYVAIPLTGLGLLGLSLFLMIKTHAGEDIRLPVIAELADKWLESI